MHDLVYPLSPGPLAYDELKYSLRSFETNTNVERVWFLGGRPMWLRTKRHIKTAQPHDKWKNARLQLRAALDSPHISDPFWWMNDDFYLMEPVDELPLWHGGPYDEWLAKLGPRFAKSRYVTEGRRTISVLKGQGVTEVLGWSLHTPLLVFKDSMHRALELDAEHKQTLHPRTLYANLAGLEGLRAPCHDVKGTAAPKHVYASSSNAGWRASPLGKHIRAKFTEPSRWE